MRRRRWLLWAASAAMVVCLFRPTSSVHAHAGSADGSRPHVTDVDPNSGIAASAIFVGSWAIHLSVVSGETVSVLDETSRPFLRIGPDGVHGDRGSPAWYTSAVAPNPSGVVRLPDGIGPDTAADWRLLSRGTAWSWFDPRISARPGEVTPAMLRQGVPVRLGDFSIPLQVGGHTGQITGYLEFEPPRGRYVHRLLSSISVAPRVEVGLLGGQAVPTLTVRNDSDEAVTVLGAEGEPFLRVGSAVEANAASPTWVQVSRTLGRIPKRLVDAAAAPQWEPISEGRLMSWTDLRSRPPDTEPPAAVLRAGRPVEVRRWTIPLLIGAQAAEVRGATSFEPSPTLRRRSGPGAWPVAAALGLVLLPAGVVLWRWTLKPKQSEPPG